LIYRNALRLLFLNSRGVFPRMFLLLALDWQLSFSTKEFRLVYFDERPGRSSNSWSLAHPSISGTANSSTSDPLSSPKPLWQGLGIRHDLQHRRSRNSHSNLAAQPPPFHFLTLCQNKTNGMQRIKQRSKTRVSVRRFGEDTWSTVYWMMTNMKVSKHNHNAEIQATDDYWPPHPQKNMSAQGRRGRLVTKMRMHPHAGRIGRSRHVDGLSLAAEQL